MKKFDKARGRVSGRNVVGGWSSEIVGCVGSSKKHLSNTKGEVVEIVGRAELKLAEAARAFDYDFRGKVVLDIGSSTGGFTEYALRQGAREVIAIEKGTNQMRAPLRYDRRIKLYEKTDFLGIDVLSERAISLKLATTPLPHVKCGSVRCSALPRISSPTTTLIQVELKRVDMVLADVSFVSLTKILAQAKKLVPRKVNYLVMLKPQFEAYPDQLVRGVVKNERMRREIMKRFEKWLGQNGFVIVKKRDNETVGKVGGNRERFYWLRLGGNKIGRK